MFRSAPGEEEQLVDRIKTKVGADHQPYLVTSNLPFEDWSVFASERLTGALLDRLTHHVNILEMNGDSYLSPWLL